MILAHGRQLIHRRWMRRGSAALVAVVLIVVAAVPAHPDAVHRFPRWHHRVPDLHAARAELRSIYDPGLPGKDLVQVAVQDG